MKHINLLAFAVAGLTFAVSCKNDEEPKSSPSTPAAAAAPAPSAAPVAAAPAPAPSAPPVAAAPATAPSAAPAAGTWTASEECTDLCKHVLECKVGPFANVDECVEACDAAAEAGPAAEKNYECLGKATSCDSMKACK